MMETWKSHSDRDVYSKKSHKRMSPMIIFPREGKLWNFGVTHKIHKRFLTERTGNTWDGKGRERQRGHGDVQLF